MYKSNHGAVNINTLIAMSSKPLKFLSMVINTYPWLKSLISAMSLCEICRSMDP